LNTLRRLLFGIWLYGAIAVIGILGAPWFVTSKKGAAKVIDVWAAVEVFGARHIMGIKIDVRGQEHLPQGAFMIAGKHQCMFDTIAPFTFVEGLSFVLKRELAGLPIFGWYAQRGGMIVVDREAQMAAMKHLIREAKDRTAEGRRVLIFPEGTRQLIGATPDYKPGVAALYTQLGIPCVPMALDTARLWGPKGLPVRGGVATFEFLPVIEPGLKRDAFMARLESQIETASAALLAEKGIPL